MEIKTKFDCGQKVFFVYNSKEAIMKKCPECDDGTITTTKGSILSCPVCFGTKEVFDDDKNILKILSTKVKSIGIYNDGSILRILYGIKIDSCTMNYSEGELFATEGEAEAYMEIQNEKNN